MLGTIVKSTGSWYKVQEVKTSTLYECRIKGKIRLDGLKSTNPIAVGDNVNFELENDNTGVISEILARKNYIIRKSANLSKQSHIIAANIDRAYIVVTIKSPKTLLSFIDRFLVSAEAYSIPVTIIINKIDLYTEKDLHKLEEWENIYNSIGYQTIRLSAKEDINISLLKEEMEGKISAFAGNSGVGKSSLINAIAPGLHLKTKTVSQSHNKGQHTTTFAEMHKLENGGYIIDTPGIKAFGLLDFDVNELGHFFPEIFKASSNCQFNNCTHTHEPSCAVLHNVEQGKIHISRYENYLKMFDDENSKHR